jgi:hypothetical protein
LLPAKDLGKPENHKCRHQRHGVGCVIYARRPRSCEEWSCRWLIGDDTAELRRPDRSHYVIDPLPDYLTVRHNETGDQQVLPVVQIWADPRHRDCHRDPALRRFIERRAADGWGALVRFGFRDTVLFICAPALSHDREWHEVTTMEADREHSLMDTIHAIATGEVPK